MADWEWWLDTVVTPEMFAQCLCDDFSVPHVQFVPRIVAAINERVKEYQNQVLPMLTRSPDVIRGKLNPDGDADSRALIEVFRRAREGSEEIKTESGVDEDDGHVRIVTGEEDEFDEGPLTVEEAMATVLAESSEELRILIKVGGPKMGGSRC